MKRIERSRLLEHLRGGSGGVLAHTIGDHVLDSKNVRSTVSSEIDDPHALAIGISVDEGGGDNLKAELQVGMDPAERRVPESDRLGEALFAERMLELLQCSSPAGVSGTVRWGEGRLPDQVPNEFEGANGAACRRDREFAPPGASC